MSVRLSSVLHTIRYSMESGIAPHAKGVWPIERDPAFTSGHEVEYRVTRSDGLHRDFRFDLLRSEDDALKRVGEVYRWLREPVDEAARCEAWAWWHALADLHADPAVSS